MAALAVKPDGKEAAVAAGRSVRIWHLAKSATIKELEGFASEVSSVAWRQDGAQIAAGDRSHTIRLWKGDFTPDGLIETPADAVLGLAYVPGKPMLVSAGSDGIPRLWQLPVAKPRRIDSKGAARVFVVCHEGNRAAKIMRVWTLAEAKLVKEIAGNGQPVIALALCGNGSQAA
ncbi:MAG: WD40 repeat domain-containing protein, partial [Isosphaeraceae bacterium]